MKIGNQFIVEDDLVSCGFCSAELGDVLGNIKRNLAIEQVGVEEAGPHYEEPSRYINQEIVFRRFYCPGCATMLTNEVARPEDPLHDEVTLFES
ncbi:acetone carboxylase subunit gamma [Natronorubrum halophilum]|uniref:acetone carboxylase subunit gamma n=1 Tax=Natronorubrum halophilum TaxID=1702106 RepID=UPI000EF66ECB|nr:acetone carboxylase subunit gamma [Natronorubrum halophilum]